jgi:hypothetical protein
MIIARMARNPWQGGWCAAGVMPISALIVFSLSLHTGCSSCGARSSTIRFHPGEGGEPSTKLRDVPVVPVCVTLSAPGSQPPTLPVGQHRVILSWEASVPASSMPRDMIAGYCVYRSTNSKDTAPQLISPQPFSGISCSDSRVANGVTYTYWVAAVSDKNKQSRMSKSATARIPKTGSPPATPSPVPSCGN